MNTIKKILIFLLLPVMLFGCAASNPAQTSGEKIEKSAAEDADPQSSDAVQTSEQDEDIEKIQAYEEEWMDPFGTPIWSVGAEESYFPLYAMIKEEDIYLYGIQDSGMVLYQDGKGTYFDWPGITATCIVPKMVYSDFDSDDKKELVITLYVGAGQWSDLMDLHILEIEDADESGKTQYTDYALLGEDVKEWMREPISATMAEDKTTIMVETCGEEYELKANPDHTFKGITYGDIVYFLMEEDRVKVQVDLAADYEEVEKPKYFGFINTYVTFDGENFIFDEYTFTAYEDYGKK